VNFDPHIPPVESSTLAPESLQWASDEFARLSVTCRSLATGQRNGQVSTAAAVSELDTLAGEAIALAIRLTAMHTDGTQQLATERQVVGFHAGRRA
jgi:hypothetical protein